MCTSSWIPPMNPGGGGPPPLKHTVQKQKNQISQLWNFIETWGFLVDLQILADRSRLLNIRSCFFLAHTSEIQVK